ncbi:MAG: 6-phosphogluconolactonase [Methylobacter sp.]|nr:6-phosphogluconolactonase [Methylobacter sp.]MDP2100762.1 6-phosphogluconolactonase [Methylobacter sp.]MDP2427033.1 6-phosphogluconolactonase [Methylobacter sp.]MDP3053011.1 6-phosphogluconolactonase [Methylobacter sp.]MDP3363881.1 6-phosphogluconolactonase [Methylobacter sp.]
MQQNSRWHTLETADDVAFAACSHILNAADTAIAERGKFKLVLAGGSTPEKVYRLLAESKADWANWHIYYGDERCLPADHPDRNSLMASQVLLDKVAIPAAQIFTMSAELGPEVGADRYQLAVSKAGMFDMVLLGMGEDGHTASLFPGHQHPQDELVHAVYNSPKPPPERISISAKALGNTRELIFLITGANKQDAVQQWRSGADLPVAAIVPENPVDIYIDNDAYKP